MFKKIRKFIINTVIKCYDSALTLCLNGYEEAASTGNEKDQAYWAKKHDKIYAKIEKLKSKMD